MNQQIIIAGFGGQGVLFTGKFMAYAGLYQGFQVSWLPSYGPEMRGGTANCNVVISDLPVGSPIVINCTSLIAMNAPSLEKFEGSVLPGGKVFVDSTLISAKVQRTDVETFYIPATQLANEKEMKGLSNMIMLGKFIKETGICEEGLIEKTLKKVVPPKKADLIAKNMEAIQLGYSL